MRCCEEDVLHELRLNSSLLKPLCEAERLQTSSFRWMRVGSFSFADVGVTRERSDRPAAPLDSTELQQLEGASIALSFSSTIVLVDC